MTDLLEVATLAIDKVVNNGIKVFQTTEGNEVKIGYQLNRVIVVLDYDRESKIVHPDTVNVQFDELILQINTDGTLTVITVDGKVFPVDENVNPDVFENALMKLDEAVKE